MADGDDPLTVMTWLRNEDYRPEAEGALDGITAERDRLREVVEQADCLAMAMMPTTGSGGGPAETMHGILRAALTQEMREKPTHISEAYRVFPKLVLPYAQVSSGSLVIHTSFGFTRWHALGRAAKWAKQHGADGGLRVGRWVALVEEMPENHCDECWEAWIESESLPHSPRSER